MDDDELTSRRSLRWFPWKVYAYVFGACCLGFGMGYGMHEPGWMSLATLAAGCLLCVLGFFGLRPYMRASRAAVKAMTDERAHPQDAE